MDTLEHYYPIIYQVLNEYYQISYSYGHLERRLIISEDKRNYILLTLGWQNDSRVHGCLVHREIIEGKIWIHRDGTEDGIVNDLLDLGVPKNKIVLGFYHPTQRPYMEFAVN
ncbi:MAG: XisI protein [Roseofilum sp. SBFL]|uniref:XisI protein n=1 Tax=unclassified Roseofilum TaxID=2620099 RepID=UPI001B239270|nr:MULTISPECIES: XisI protein [unclassified Roseofilum]MBP0015235.1 XisI protein [Roseofilum sp. SID3]MBP0023599.1 XisI protein [Roseofilum sp. SID2]MBP0039260.1 XisI protein [Roseofilum sp. SID1]MBP0042722.1 XisI protein [Roseofilum sp. SBFL]